MNARPHTSPPRAPQARSALSPSHTWLRRQQDHEHQQPPGPARPSPRVRGLHVQGGGGSGRRAAGGGRRGQRLSPGWGSAAAAAGARRPRPRQPRPAPPTRSPPRPPSKPGRQARTSHCPEPTSQRSAGSQAPRPQAPGCQAPTDQRPWRVTRPTSSAGVHNGVLPGPPRILLASLSPAGPVLTPASDLGSPRRFRPAGPGPTSGLHGLSQSNQQSPTSPVASALGCFPV